MANTKCAQVFNDNGTAKILKFGQSHQNGTGGHSHSDIVAENDLMYCHKQTFEAIRCN